MPDYANRDQKPSSFDEDRGNNPKMEVKFELSDCLVCMI
jgi:hypothetical protein